MAKNSNKKVIVLGVCGKPSSGKSEVLNVLNEIDWLTIDSDKVVHDLYKADCGGQRKIADFFGEEFLRKDGSVNRVKLRKVVFKDPKKLVILNKLIHPLVLSEIRSMVDGYAKGGGEKVAIEAISFDEKLLGSLVGDILYVERPHDRIVDFLQKGRGLSQELIDGLLGSFEEPSRKDYVIDNDSTLKDLKEKVIIALEKLTSN